MQTVGYARRYCVTSKFPRHFQQSHLKCRNGEVLVSAARSETSLLSTIEIKIARTGKDHYCSTRSETTPMFHGRIEETPKGTSLMVLTLTLQRLVSRPRLSKPQLACAIDNFVEQHLTRLAAVKPYGLRRLIDLNQYLGHDHH